MGTDAACSSSSSSGGEWMWWDSRFVLHSHVPGCHGLTSWHFCFSADELLQDQKADLDQFLSSISESQPDITVSSEESVEVPVSEGKPYRPFQVTSLGSHSDPEGEELGQAASRTTMGLWRAIVHKSKPVWMIEAIKCDRTVAERAWIGLQYILCQCKCTAEPWVWT